MKYSALIICNPINENEIKNVFLKNSIETFFINPKDAQAFVDLKGFNICIAAVAEETSFNMPVGLLIKGLAPHTPLIALVNDTSINSIEVAARHGAEFIFPQQGSWEDLALKVKQLVNPDVSAHVTVTKKGAVLTASAQISKILQLAERLGVSGQSILLTGPTGAGKELLAQVIGSAGGERPMMSLNCAALPESLMEAELFGYTKGAFSGAAKDSPGLIVQANEGVLFLDEIAELSPSMQAKLLRVLDTGEVRPLGGNKTTRVKFQLVCATHKDINPDQGDESFRSDLYYRVASIKLALPPLTERKEDIALLAQYFAAAQKQGVARSFTAEALILMQQLPWPGNVRELRNFVTKCALLNSATTLGAQVVKTAQLNWVHQLGVNLATDIHERDVLLLALELSGGVVADAARLCQKNRTEMYRLISRYGIDEYRLH